MKTIFSKVSVKDGLPTKDGDYITNIYHSTPFKKGDWIVSGSGIPNHFYKKDIQWWMKEIELPNDDDLEKRFPTNINEASDIKGTNSDNLCKQLGAEWMRDFILDF